ncbi:MAG: hypothetical protein ABIT96_00760 [Ferruginibacter sp.]
MKSNFIKGLEILPLLCAFAFTACMGPSQKSDFKKSTDNSPILDNSEVLLPNPARTQNLMMVN